MPSHAILVVGASVRAAAASIRRAGGEPVAFDCYRDADLAAGCAAVQLAADDYPARIYDRVRHLDPMPWLYTGALENHPDVIEQVAGRFRLLGIAGRPLRDVRDTAWLAAVVRAAGLLMPEVANPSGTIAADGSWLVKPRQSGGGEGVRVWRGGPRPDPARFYHQVRQAGRPASALFVRDRAGTRLMGVTRQLIGRPGNRFAYRGSVGPWPVPASALSDVVGLGRRIGDAAGLVGLFGLDLIVRDGRAWLIEVNPRYTAAVEVLEAATGRSIMAEHLRACGFALPPVSPAAVLPGLVVGKAILFARSAGVWAESVPVATPDVADIPHPGTSFEVGQPIMTVFGRGRSVAACRLDLLGRLRAWSDRIAVAQPR